jgi:ribonuclease R
LIKIKLLTYLSGHIGEAYHAVIVAVEEFGFFCRLVEIPAEGLVHITALGDDYYYLESATHTLIGRRGGKRFRLGDQIEVTIARVDVDRRELDLILGPLPAAEPELVPRSARPPRERASDRPSPRAKPAAKPTKARKKKGKGRR